MEGWHDEFDVTEPRTEDDALLQMALSLEIDIGEAIARVGKLLSRRDIRPGCWPLPLRFEEEGEWPDDRRVEIKEELRTCENGSVVLISHKYYTDEVSEPLTTWEAIGPEEAVSRLISDINDENVAYGIQGEFTDSLGWYALAKLLRNGPMQPTWFDDDLTIPEGCETQDTYPLTKERFKPIDQIILQSIEILNSKGRERITQSDIAKTAGYHPDSVRHRVPRLVAGGYIDLIKDDRGRTQSYRNLNK